MNVIRWNPFAEIDSLFNRLTPRATFPRFSTEEEGGMSVGFSPSADISETEKEYVVRAELPGMKKEDVKVTMSDGFLTIEGERKLQKEDKDEKFHRVEQTYGYFNRSFALPDNILADAIRCESKDGVLTVHVPKTEQRKPREITVQ